MWNRVFVALIIIASVVTGFLIYYAGSWLQSIGSPRDAFEGFVYYSSIPQAVLWASIVVLLIVANVVLWTSGRSWALWMTLLFVAVFVFARYAWLDYAGFGFAGQYGFDGDQLRWGFMTSLLTTAAAAGVIYFDVFLVGRLRRRLENGSSTESGAASDPDVESPSMDETGHSTGGELERNEEER